MSAGTATVLRYVGVELRRTFRDVGFVIFGIGTPVLMYSIFTSVGDQGGTAGGWAVLAMVGMASYGALGAALTAGSAVAEDKANGWLRQLRVTPLTPAQVVAGRTLTGSLMVLPAVVVVLLTARLLNGVDMAAWQWLALTGLLWVGSLPFTMLGIANGYLLSQQTANVTNVTCNLAFAVIGGLWFPVSEFPSGLAAVAEWTPGYLFARLGHDTVDGHAPGLVTVAVLAAWLLVFGAYAAHGYRRAGRRA
ncbi:ABC transporter permease [Streptomyces abyssomicinicus]|uniref:ABC transporter permease n=1 Tax=Streptomyces abyssomicinicus TaxID=574929 RepID=UPI00124F7B2B|nr:ABC transporter permease [Streptomyces abyssomicinicus]